MQYHGHGKIRSGIHGRIYTLPDEITEFEMDELLSLKNNMGIYKDSIEHPKERGVKSVEEYIEDKGLNPSGTKVTKRYIGDVLHALDESIGEVDRLLEAIYRKNRERDKIPERTAASALS